MDKKFVFLDKAFEDFYKSEAEKINELYKTVSDDFLSREKKELIKLATSVKIKLGDVIVPALKEEGVEYANFKWQQINEKLPTLSYKYSKAQQVENNEKTGSAPWNIKSIAPIAIGGTACAATIGGCIIADVSMPVLIGAGVVGAALLFGGICVGYYIRKSSASGSKDGTGTDTVIIFAKDENLKRLRAFIDNAKETAYLCMEENNL